MSETYEFGCAECEARGTVTHYYSGASKVKIAHKVGCKVAKMEKGDLCPDCGGTETDCNESSAVCLNPDCGYQWDLGETGMEEHYTP